MTILPYDVHNPVVWAHFTVHSNDMIEIALGANAECNMANPCTDHCNVYRLVRYSSE